MCAVETLLEMETNETEIMYERSMHKYKYKYK